MKVFIGSDHTGRELRAKIIDYLNDSFDFDFIDCGTHKEKSNYVTEALKVAENVAMNEGSRGILLCGTGIGVSIAANKVKGIRAALCHQEEYAQLAREHNDANILVMGARFIDEESVYKMINKFFTTEFAGGRHADRVNSLIDYEESCIDC